MPWQISFSGPEIDDAQDRETEEEAMTKDEQTDKTERERQKEKMET